MLATLENNHGILLKREFFSFLPMEEYLFVSSSHLICCIVALFLTMPATYQDHCQGTIQRQDDEESEEDEIGLLVRL